MGQLTLLQGEVQCTAVNQSKRVQIRIQTVHGEFVWGNPFKVKLNALQLTKENGFKFEFKLQRVSSFVWGS